MRNEDKRRPPLPGHLTQAELDFYVELRRLVDAAGVSFRSEPQPFTTSQWERWLNGQSLPPRKAVSKIIEKLAAEGSGAGHLLELWGRAFVPGGYPDEQRLARPSQLPIATRHFIGRETQLEQLTSLAGHAAGRSGPAVIVIEGTAGVGKTTLANQFGHLIRDRFPDGQLYVNMHGFGEVNPLTAEEALRGFIDAFGVSPKSIPASPADQAALYRGLLADKRVLIVVDNAADAEQVRPLLPAVPGCLTMVTSRSPLTGLVAEGVHSLRLDPFTMTEARTLMTRRLGPDRVERELRECDQLIELCARLPLALSIIAAHAAAHPEFSLAAVTNDFRGHDTPGSGEPATTARTVFSWAYRHLSDPAARMFRLLSVHPGPDITVSAAASLCGIPVGQARTALDELARADLLDEHVPGRFTFHDLLRAYAGEQAGVHQSDDKLTAAELRLIDHYLRTAYEGLRRLHPARLGVLPEPQAGTAVAEFAGYEQAQAWFRAERTVLLAMVSRAEARRYDEHCWQLAWAMVPVLGRSAQWHDLLAMMRLAFRAADRSGDLGSLGYAHYELGRASMTLGDATDADAHIRKALELFTRLGDQPGVAQAHYGLALLRAQEARWAEALPHAAEALRLRRAFGTAAIVAASENGVGWIHAHLGEHEEALRHCATALDLHRESGDRHGTADTLDSIGFIYLRMGDHEQAVSHYEQAASTYRAIGDPDLLAVCLIGLGDAQLAAGRAEAARRSWEEALTLRESLGGDTHPAEARLAQLA